MTKGISFDQALTAANDARANGLCEVRAAQTHLNHLIVLPQDEMYKAVTDLQGLEARVLDLHTRLNAYVTPGAKSSDTTAAKAMAANYAFLTDFPDAVKSVTGPLLQRLAEMDPPMRNNGYSARVQVYHQALLDMQAASGLVLDKCASPYTTREQLVHLGQNLKVECGYQRVEKALADLTEYVQTTDTLKPYQREAAYTEIAEKQAALLRWAPQVASHLKPVIRGSIDTIDNPPQPVVEEQKLSWLEQIARALPAMGTPDDCK